jgi:hypothetical protein
LAVKPVLPSISDTCQELFLSLTITLNYQGHLEIASIFGFWRAITAEIYSQEKYPQKNNQKQRAARV